MSECTAGPRCSVNATLYHPPIPRSPSARDWPGEGWERRRGSQGFQGVHLLWMTPGPLSLSQLQTPFSSHNHPTQPLQQGPASPPGGRPTPAPGRSGRSCNSSSSRGGDRGPGRTPQARALWGPFGLTVTVLRGPDVETSWAVTHSKGSRSPRSWTRGTASLRTSPGG